MTSLNDHAVENGKSHYLKALSVTRHSYNGQYASLPSWRCQFDSDMPLKKTRGL